MQTCPVENRYSIFLILACVASVMLNTIAIRENVISLIKGLILSSEWLLTSFFGIKMEYNNFPPLSESKWLLQFVEKSIHWYEVHWAMPCSSLNYKAESQCVQTQYLSSTNLHKTLLKALTKFRFSDHRCMGLSLNDEPSKSQRMTTQQDLVIITVSHLLLRKDTHQE